VATTTLSGRRSQLEAQIASLRAEGEAITRLSTLTTAQEARAAQIPGELSQARSDLAEVQQIIADEERMTAAATERHSAGAAVTPRADDTVRDRGDAWIDSNTGERAALRAGESFRSHPVIERESARRNASDQLMIAQHGGIGQMLRALSTSSGSAIVPTVWAAEIIDRAREEAAVTRAGATIVPMEAKTVQIGRLTGDPTVAFRAESGTITPSDPTFDNVTLTAKTMSTIVKGSIEFFQDAPNSDEIVTTAIAKAFAEHLDLVALYGGIESGAGSINLDEDVNPHGVLKRLLAYDSASQVLGATAGVTATNGTSITAASAYNEILDTIYTVRDGREEPNALIWSSKMARKLAKLYDSTYQPLRAPQDVLDLERIVTTKIPKYTQGTLTTATDVFAGDWSQLLIGQRLEITIQRLDELYAVNGEIGFAVHWRGDINLARPTAFAVYKALQGA